MMATPIRLVLALVLVAACQKAPFSHTDDVSTDVRFTGISGLDDLTHYYYLDGDQLVRTACGASVVHDRANCALNPLSVPAATIFKTLQDEWETSVKTWQDSTHDLEVVVLNLDQERLALLSATPPPDAAALKTQMDALDATLATKDVALADLGNQVALVQQSLATTDSVELRLQLANLEAQHSQMAGDRDTLAGQLETVRQQYIAAAGAADSDYTFQNLSTQRAEQVGKLDSSRTNLDRTLGELAALSRVVGFIGQSGVNFDVLGNSQAFLVEQEMLVTLERQFDTYHPAEALAEFQGIAGMLSINWAGNWSCQGSFVGSNVTAYTVDVIHVKDVGDESGGPLTGFSLEAVMQVPFEAGAQTLDLNFDCTLKAAFDVQCQHQAASDGAPYAYFDIQDTFAVNRLTLTLAGQPLDGGAICTNDKVKSPVPLPE